MTLNLASAAELSLSVTRRAPRLVLDPGLCLSALGPLLVERLQGEAELWLPRELWRILDNSDYFSMHPEALVGSPSSVAASEYGLTLRRVLSSRLSAAEMGEHAERSEPDPSVASPFGHTLEAWDTIRSSTDLLGLRLFWLGDGLAESLVPAGYAEDLHPRFEALAERLDRLLAPSSPLACGRRDALALSLALGGVPVLSSLDAASSLPALCAFALGFTCTEVAGSDPFAVIEREQYQSALVRARCAPLLWSTLPLSVVHVHAPNASARACVSQERGLGEANGFTQASLFWYRL